MFLVSSCSCLCSIHWSQVLSREWRCSWSSADRRCWANRRCSNYIWAINNFNPTKVWLMLEVLWYINANVFFLFLSKLPLWSPLLPYTSIFEVKLTFDMLTVRGQQHSFSTHGRVFLWKCQSFWDRKCLDLRGTRTPNLRIHAECSNLVDMQSSPYWSNSKQLCCFLTGSSCYINANTFFLAPTTSTSLLPVKVWLILEVWQYLHLCLQKDIWGIFSGPKRSISHQRCCHLFLHSLCLVLGMEYVGWCHSHQLQGSLEFPDTNLRVGDPMWEVKCIRAHVCSGIFSC